MSEIVEVLKEHGVFQSIDSSRWDGFFTVNCGSVDHYILVKWNEDTTMYTTNYPPRWLGRYDMSKVKEA